MEAVSSPGGADGRAMDAAWHGAEAYHFWLLAHRQLYSGQVRAGGQAMCWVLAAGLLLGRKGGRERLLAHRQLHSGQVRAGVGC
jgi:hypothetical protein